MPKIYVAGKYADAPRLYELCVELELTSRVRFEVTHALLDIDGVRDADIVLAVMDDHSYPYQGTWTEVGAAVALNKRVIIVSPVPPKNIFAYHPQIELKETVTQALQYLYSLFSDEPELEEAMHAKLSAASLPYTPL
jgi:hypothetical protein